ncbi:hypothetical protein AVEN_224254-1 [Araneus ventricosus]|uniref:Uncharacterized protein n=1 Tax=Araneus ventricosus TaxID=182803 RepID=A0A4Y2NDU8_ARAVE|nr:hypothetical protein AVEN_224254-1 [Araneus ventricosus]
MLDSVLVKNGGSPFLKGEYSGIRQEQNRTAFFRATSPYWKVVMCRSLRNETADTTPQKERPDPISTKRNEFSKKNESAVSDS